MTSYSDFLSTINPKLPHNLEAEQGLLGCLLCENNTFDRIFDITRKEHFYAPAHQRIFEEIKKRIESGQKALPTTLFTYFENDEGFKSVGGAKNYLIDLASNVVAPINAKDYALHIRELFYKRSLIEVIADAKTAIDAQENLESVISKTETALSSIQDGGGDDFEATPSIWGETLKHIEAVKNGEIKLTSTGYSSIDKIISGFGEGKLYVLAARPGMGKTALALNIAENVSSQGDVLFFSLEMPKSELCMRLGSRKTSISVGNQSRGAVDDYQLSRLAATAMPENLYVIDKSGMNISKISMLCRRFKRNKRAKLIVVDYLGLIEGDSRMQKVHQIEEITQRLKNLSKELSTPIMLLCQLSRALEMRDDKRPLLSDLRDSGAIEQDADVVMFIYRNEYYSATEKPKKREKERDEDFQSRLDAHNASMEREKGKADIIFAKNRQGILGSVSLNFDGERQCFFEGGLN